MSDADEADVPALASGVNGLHHRLLSTDGLDHPVGAQPVGEFLDSGHAFVAALGDDLGRAVLPGISGVATRVPPASGMRSPPPCYGFAAPAPASSLASPSRRRRIYRPLASEPAATQSLDVGGVRFGGSTDSLGLMHDRRPLSIPVRLVLASTLMLFLELSLIRWSGAQVVHLSYFSNFILLGSFLGIGLGFLRANRSKRRQPLYSIVALLAYVGFLSTFPVAVNRDQESVIYFTSLSTSGPPIWVTLPVIFLAVAAIMAGPGELVADCFSQLPRLDAYRYDLIGSLIGIVGFTVCAFTGAPPLVWFLLVAALFVVLLAGASRVVTITLLAVTVAMFAYPLVNATGVFWSPYYRVTTFAQSDGNNGTEWQVYVNGIPHQRLTTAATRLMQEPFYDEPYRRVTKPPEQVLIVGAGTGTDVSIALSHGVSHVDAVEIDPRLLRFGREHNPDRAYHDPRVTAYVNDGRAFLERTDKKYDLILFALPDSLTLVSGASALRLESYLFTEEAIQSAREHLAPGGAFSMYNFYREQWLVDRLGNTLATTFGHSPCLLSSPQAVSLAVFVVGATPADQRCETTWAPTGTPPEPSTDDRPFLYVPKTPGSWVSRRSIWSRSA